MKLFSRIFVSALMMVWLCGASFAQESADTTVVLHKVVKLDGHAFIGKIISQDAREVLIETKETGLVYIPKHEIKGIFEIKPGESVGIGDLFSTRYFLTTNGFPVKKGDNYVQWNLFGPDFQFGIAENLGVGIMTSWVGMPIIGTAKYSIKLGKNLSGGFGFLAGTGSWAYPEFGLLLPFGMFTIGNRTNNINFSAGYGALFSEQSHSLYTLLDIPGDYSTNTYTEKYETYNNTDGRPLFSVAGIFRLNSKFSFVFDSFIMLAGKDKTVTSLVQTEAVWPNKVTYMLVDEVVEQNPLIVLAPGLRFQANERSSFQFGFTGVHFDGEFVPFPIPMVQWFVKI